MGCFKRRKLTYHIQRERIKATENVEETNESTDISNIQLQWRSKFEHLENAFNWFLKISTISNLPSNSSMRNSPKTIERTTELWKWKLSISKVDKIPLQAPTLSHVIMPCGGVLSLKKTKQETKLGPVYQSRSSLIMIETLVPFQNLKLLFWRIENDISLCVFDEQRKPCKWLLILYLKFSLKGYFIIIWMYIICVRSLYWVPLKTMEMPKHWTH